MMGMKKTDSWCRVTIPFLCLTGAFSACGSHGKDIRTEEPGDSADVIVVGCERKTVDEAMDKAFGDEKSQDSLTRELHRVIKEKYKHLGDSLQRKLLRGEKIH